MGTNERNTDQNAAQRSAENAEHPVPELVRRDRTREEPCRDDRLQRCAGGRTAETVSDTEQHAGHTKPDHSDCRVGDRDPNQAADDRAGNPADGDQALEVKVVRQQASEDREHQARDHRYR